MCSTVLICTLFWKKFLISFLHSDLKTKFHIQTIQTFIHLCYSSGDSAVGDFGDEETNQAGDPTFSGGWKSH
jgi:hypothetical protein